MVETSRKGKKFIMNLENQWIEETGSRPTDLEIIDHIITMDNEEFDSYVEGKKYTVREEIHQDYDITMERLKAENKTLRNQINIKK